MSLEQNKLLLLHELTHVKRHDPVAVFLYRLCCSIFWFNPLYKQLESGFTNAMELNCDADVLKQVLNKKFDYARALLASLKIYQTPLNMHGLTLFSDPKHDKSIFEVRIREAMASDNKNRYDIIQKLVLLTAFILLGVFSFIAKATLNVSQLTNNVKGLKPIKEAWISSNFDEVNEYRGPKPHQGIDFASKMGIKITASFSGRVLIANSTSLHKNYGKVILIQNADNNMQSLYAHLDSFNVTAGQIINQGDVIGTVGNTGRVTGPHLHIELIKNNKRVNPNNYLDL